MSKNNFSIGRLDVAPMAVGTMYFGTTVAQQDAWACLDAAHDAGARFLDTANNYAFWAGGVGDESEDTIGRWLHRRGSSVRDEMVIATKVGARPAVPDGGLDDVLGLSGRAIAEQVEGSLRRLQTDHIDILYAHIDDRRVPLDETLGALADCVRKGQARTIAASNLTADRLRQALEAGPRPGYQALQQRFTYLVPAPDADLGPHVVLTDEVRAVCEAHHVTCLGYSPLLSGSYTRPERPLPSGYAPDALDALHDVATQVNLDAGQTVLAWMVNRAAPVIPVVGVSRPEHVRSAWAAVTTPLDAEQTRRLDDARHG
ncbi:aldo/keto reductase [Nigerium massiliense]|uniref:aldo/keto reductase n=1 Tax=Nigerium massiliense TaxID=1522317 RepID=UPI00058B5403|nr:aldo/keto reductase [Nigerium massiliense]